MVHTRKRPVQCYFSLNYVLEKPIVDQKSRFEIVVAPTIASTTRCSSATYSTLTLYMNRQLEFSQRIVASVLITHYCAPDHSYVNTYCCTNTKS